ncbi:ribosome assembly factor SBDS [Candidatus Woesearchaeota archaeon]|nr:ribosome assembly factor SBDS [Candidatus Woesearchaeota archaeon]
MPQKPTIARLKRYGKTFELSVDPDKALAYKKGSISDVDEVLHSDSIFTDAKKGERPSEAELKKVFATTDQRKIADLIIREGEIQHTAEHRAQEKEQRKRKLITMIHTQAVDPKTGYPHPPERIEAALEQGKIHLDDHRPVEQQFDEIIKKLRPIIPIHIEQKQLVVIIPAEFAGKMYSVIHSSGRVLKEDWLSNGNWSVKLELPAGLVSEFIDKMNSLTHGEVIVEMEKK